MVRKYREPCHFLIYCEISASRQTHLESYFNSWAIRAEPHQHLTLSGSKPTTCDRWGQYFTIHSSSPFWTTWSIHRRSNILMLFRASSLHSPLESVISMHAGSRPKSMPSGTSGAYPRASCCRFVHQPRKALKCRLDEILPFPWVIFIDVQWDPVHPYPKHCERSFTSPGIH